MSYNTFQSQDSENDPDSPEVYSMTQRAREHGIDVTWGGSPTRQRNKTLQKKKHKPTKDSTPTSTKVRRKSLVTNLPKQLFKPATGQTLEKTGIHKFMDGVKSLFPEGSSSWPPRLSQKTSTPRTTTSISESENVHTEINANVANHVFETTNDLVTCSETKTCKEPKLHSDNKTYPDELSLSLQNEFLNDTEFETEMIKTSQEVEEKFLQEQSTANVPKNRNSMWNFFEQDSFDDLFVSKELDQLIAQSQQMDAQPRKANQSSLERHKSMPTGRARTPLKRRFVD